MRIKLNIKNEKAQSIPINYQYPLMSSIIKILNISSNDYAKFIHDSGYLGLDGKRRKLFTFSKLYFSPSPKVENSSLLLESRSFAVLFISSPMLDDFLTNFIIGISKNQKISICSSDFVIENIEAIPQPNLTQIEKFTTLSPMVLTTVRDYYGKKSTYYYRPLDDGIEKAVRKSLVGKYQSIHNSYPKNDQISFQVDLDYIARRGGENRISKLIKIKEDQKQQTNIKAFECPFSLKGAAELLQVAWDCGIGDKTHMGFGCIGC